MVLDQDDFSKANVKATETIDIVQAVPHDAVPPQYFEKPLYVVPGKGGHQAVPHPARDAAAHRQGRAWRPS